MPLCFYAKFTKHIMRNILNFLEVLLWKILQTNMYGEVIEY